MAQEKTGEEILREIGPVDAVVAGVGTGGTLMGPANVMERANPRVKVIAVEPEEAAFMYGAMIGRSDVEIKEHQIQGIGDGFIPDIVDMSKVDEVITVASTKAIDMARKLSSKYGLFVGISSGANMLAALRVVEKHNKVVMVLPDRGERWG